MKHKWIILLLFTTQAIAAPWQFSAGRLEYFPQENRAQATGSVLFTRDDLTVTAAEGDFYLDENKVRLCEVSGEAAGFFLKARSVLATPSQTELDQAQLTGCALPRPEYFLASQKVILSGDQLSLQGNKLHLFNFLAMPLPSLTLPVGAKLPLPTPEMGSSKTRGLWGGLTIPNFSGNNRQGGLTLLYSQKKGPLVGQTLTLEKGNTALDLSLRWEKDWWGGVSWRSGSWQLVAERELWTGEFDEQLSKFPELSYSFHKDLGLFSVWQNFSLGNLRESAVADSRLRWQSNVVAKKELGNLTIQLRNFLSMARYSENTQLAFAFTGLVGGSWELGEYGFAASAGGTYRKVSGASPFKHDRISSGSELLFASKLMRGTWQLAVEKKEDLREKAQWEITLRKDGHCFYWQLGYAQRTGSLQFELGLR